MRNTLLAILLLATLIPGCGGIEDGAPEKGADVQKTVDSLRCRRLGPASIECKPDLLPHAQDCPAHYEPGANEIAFFTGNQYDGWCQKIPTFTQIPDMSAYGWFGPSFYWHSWKVGFSAGAYVCDGRNYTQACSSVTGPYRATNTYGWLSVQALAADVCRDLRCVATMPALLPNAHICDPGYIPATNEVAIFSENNFKGWCQAIPYYTDVVNFGISGWYHPPYLQIKSAWVGINTLVSICNAPNYSGCSFLYGGLTYSNLSGWQSMQVMH